MRVYTIQGYDLREFSGSINVDRGTYSDTPIIKDAQSKLYDMLKADGKLEDNNVLWCGQDSPILNGETGRYLHEIDADARDVVAIVNTLIWCHIIGYEPRYILREDDVMLQQQAANSGGDFRSNLRRLEDQYLAENIPPDLWSAVVKTTVDRKSDQIILKFPFAFSTIVNVQIISADDRATRAQERRRRTPSQALTPTMRQE